MSMTELDRLKVFEQIKARRLTKIEAAKRLGLCREQVHRLYKKYCTEGAKGLISRKRGQPSNNRKSDLVKDAIIKVIREQYHDFGPTFAHEKLTEEHDFNISDETVRKIMMQAGIWKGKKRKHPKVPQMRVRRPARGELIQIDGSPHAWFEDRRDSCCLLVLIDDATSEIMGLRFVENECLQGYFDVIRDYLKRCGRPIALYSDRHTIFHAPDVEALSGTGETRSKAPGYRMRGGLVTVCERVDEIILLYNNQRLTYTTFDKCNRRKQPVASKDLNAYVDTSKMRRRLSPIILGENPWKPRFR